MPARRYRLRLPVTTQSGSTRPPGSVTGSLLVTAMILQVSGPLQLSVAFTVIFTGTKRWLFHRRTAGVAVTLLMVGGAVSLTVTRKEQVAGLPAASVAVQFTTVVPNGNTDPDGGVQMITALGSLAATT